MKTLHQPKLVDGYEQVSTTHTFHIGKAYYLPFSVTVTKYYQPIYETKTYTEEEARKKQEQLLQTYIADLKKKGVEILENNVTIECKDGECLASGNTGCKGNHWCAGDICNPGRDDSEK